MMFPLKKQWISDIMEMSSQHDLRIGMGMRRQEVYA